MELLCISMSHRTAPLDVLERLTPQDLQGVRQFQELSHVANGMFVLCTCTRREIYLVWPNAQAANRIQEELSQRAGSNLSEFLYVYRGRDALVHLFRVASSLDSMVLGETQVRGQLKAAVRKAQQEGAMRGLLSQVCQAAFRCAKHVKTVTGIGRGKVSISGIAAEMASERLQGLTGKAVLVVGAETMAKKAARWLKEMRVGRLLITNRTPEKSQALAARIGAEARPFEERFELLKDVDVVVCSTGSDKPLFTPENMEAVIRARQGRPLLMIDLGNPRNIAEEVARSEAVKIINLYDIDTFAAKHRAARAEEAKKAEALVLEAVDDFLRGQQERSRVQPLVPLRRQLQRVIRVMMDQGQEWAVLDQKQRVRMEAMGTAIFNKVLHAPTQRLRQPAYEHLSRSLARAATALFGPEDTLGEEPPARPDPAPGTNLAVAESLRQQASQIAEKEAAKTLASGTWGDGQRECIQVMAHNIAKLVSQATTARLCAMAPGPEKDQLVTTFTGLFRL